MIEGEGTVQKSGRNRLVLKIANTDVELISALLRLTGSGTVSVQRYPMGNWKMAWVWLLSRKADQQALVDQLLPYSQKVQRLRELLMAT